tara:strand:+ start:678 stop:845 length:168 start_codon:yes stop_codon:yes gene_type:complete
MVSPIVRIFIPNKGLSVSNPYKLIISPGPDPIGFEEELVATFKGRNIVGRNFKLN